MRFVEPLRDTVVMSQRIEESLIAVDRSLLKLAGICGLLAMALLGFTISQASIPDAGSSQAPQLIAQWSSDPATAHGALPAIIAGAISYMPMILFFAALQRVARSWDRSSIFSAAVGLGSMLFLSGAIVSDACSWSIPLLRSGWTGVPIPIELIAFADRAWLIALVEAHVALAVVAGATAIAALGARKQGSKAPMTLVWLGALALLSVIPLLFAPTVQAVFLISNQSRLLWMAAVAIWMIFAGDQELDRG